MKLLVKIIIITIIITLTNCTYSNTGIANALDIKKSGKDLLQIGAAIYVQGMAHEMGHMVIGDQLGASKSHMKFFTQKDGDFFFGLNTATGIKKRSWVSYRMSGFVFSNMVHEFALSSYRQNPTTFNYALALLSASDFFRYSATTLYSGKDNTDAYDPIYFQKKTGFSKESIILASLSQFIVNAYRLYSEDDTLIPFFQFKENYAYNAILIGFRYSY